MLNDAYGQSPEFVENMEKRKTVNERMKQIKLTINEGYQAEVTQLEDLRIDIASDMEALTDLVMTKLLKKEDVEVEDTAHRQMYLPIFTVKFVKKD